MTTQLTNDPQNILYSIGLLAKL